MSTSKSFQELLKQDTRYPKEAYQFVFEALEFAQNVLLLGQEVPSEPLPDDVKSPVENAEKEDSAPQRHISGQDLCCAARDYAVAQYGMLAQTVLASLGIHNTGDIGELVYNMIQIGRMRKTPADSRADFDDVFDFKTAFQDTYRKKGKLHSP
ncbi:MAG: Minf_1886 family protein [Thermoguttaceae bacterium]